MTALLDVMQQPRAERRWLLPEILGLSSFSILAGAPKAGKSTLARNLAYSVASGSTFMGYTVTRGPVIYLHLEGSVTETADAFARMGYDSNMETIHIFSERLPEKALDRLTESIANLKPSLIIIDTLIKWTRSNNVNDYSQMAQHLAPIEELARKYPVHIIGLHHYAKGGDRSPQERVLGSTAIAGGVDIVLQLDLENKIRTLWSGDPRFGRAMPERVVCLDEREHVYSGGSRQEAEIQRLEQEIIEELMDSPDGINTRFIYDHLEGQPRDKNRAIKNLMTNRRIHRTGKGQQGSPFIYHAGPPPPNEKG